MKEILRRFADDLRASPQQGERIFFGNATYDGLEISSSNFHTLSLRDSGIGSTPRIAFVDGGNQELLGGANFSLQLMRIAACVFQHDQCIERKMVEFLLYCHATKSKSLIYTAHPSILQGNFSLASCEVDPFDPALRQGHFRMPISRMGDLFRRRAELQMAESMLSTLRKGDLLLLDGQLQENIAYDDTYPRLLTATAMQQNILLTALAKTDTLLTENGKSVSSLLQQMAPSGAWYYHPCAACQPTQPDTAFVKLHPKATHLFRLEFLHDQPLQQIALLLASHAHDPVFLGYPYGMIAADQLARITNHDAAFMKTKVLISLGKDAQHLGSALAAQDAHSVLDHIRF
ncbi:hypothetical protein HZB02_07705 [Candidatus Woesearchaeota archaeon]|nr:hypothetical protein [Candidatus Woesearchaeota archaeon]